MQIGVPKEIGTHEYRVGLTPAGARELVHHGHGVLVESGAAAGAAEPGEGTLDDPAAWLDFEGAEGLGSIVSRSMV